MRTADSVSVDELVRTTNNFAVERIIGVGGFGTVYRGSDASEADGWPGEFAVKRLNDITSAERELAVLTRFQHPNIIRLIGFTAPGERMRCLVYELAERGSVEAVFRSAQSSPSVPHPLTWKTRVRIAAGVCTALNYLHRSQSSPVYHRDVKAANICLMFDFTPKLIDCGVSMLIDESRARHDATSFSVTGNNAIGTPEYMCPKYARSKKYGEKAEVFSFGIILLELLTGRVNCADQLLYDIFIEDHDEQLADALDLRAGDWPDPVVASLIELAGQATRMGPAYVHRPSMLAIMRSLKQLEVNHCQRSVDELRLSNELAALHAQFTRFRLENAATATPVRTRTCLICFDDEVPEEHGVLCHEVDGHFTCDSCLERLVLNTVETVRSTNELAIQAIAAEAQGDWRRSQLLAGCVCCMAAGTDCVSDAFSDRTIARHVSEAALGDYLQVRVLLPIASESQRIFEEAQRVLREEIQRVRDQIEAGLELEQGRALLAAQLRQQMPNARQCRQCGFGPIDHMACSDLQAHQGQRIGNARIDNRCPGCGWFSRDIHDWPPWNGTLPETADGSLHRAASELAARRQREQEEAARRQREQEAAARRQREQEAAVRRQREQEERRRKNPCEGRGGNPSAHNCEWFGWNQEGYQKCRDCGRTWHYARSERLRPAGFQ